jgi:hypothetical protein
MTIDCSADQCTRIGDFLEALHQQGKIVYGLHVAGNSLMTCFVDGLGEGRHIHFIDGGDGGYFLASRQLKAQLKQGVDASAQVALPSCDSGESRL